MYFKEPVAVFIHNFYQHAKITVEHFFSNRLGGFVSFLRFLVELFVVRKDETDVDITPNESGESLFKIDFSL